MMGIHRRKELFRLNGNADSRQKLMMRNCPVTQGMACGRSFLTKWSSEKLRWLQKDLTVCTERFLCDTGGEPSLPSDVLEPSRCGDMPPAAPHIAVPVGHWKDSCLSLYTPEPPRIL